MLRFWVQLPDRVRCVNSCYMFFFCFFLVNIRHRLHATLCITLLSHRLKKFSATPSKKNPELFIWRTESTVRVRSQPYSTSFTIYFSKAAELRFVLDSLWFPRRIIAYRLDFLVASSIGYRCYWGAFWIMSISPLSSW